ncbi:DUF1501 domain-containing protein [Verrucomicrobia bacterium]|nr:DUF1501 domain-containing protein [Verrucomicrobiota bacterium]
MINNPFANCNTTRHLSRRTLLKGLGASGLTWLTPLSHSLAVEAEKKNAPAKSVIVLWMAGGPSQLETFDPHPNTAIAAGIGAIPTSIKGIQLAQGMPHTAEVMEHISLIRSVTSKEGDHERASYNVKTGYRPNPSLKHPSIGAILSHQIPNPDIEIPTHISILPDQWPARGGYLGPEFDAFQVGDPTKSIPDVSSPVEQQRHHSRLNSLSLLEKEFARGRLAQLETSKTLHQATIQKALQMMNSDQIKAFDVNEATTTERAAYGDTPFGRGCLAARRLIQTGVRCVEVTLNGWDTHVNNAEGQAKKIAIMDPAFAALINDLKARDMLKSTVVLCGGEFGRTPKTNALDGRDHWPHGFSVAVAGGGFKGGHVMGSTDPTGVSQEPENPVKVEDIHATVQHLHGLEPDKELMTPVGRPMALSDGDVIEEIIS